MKLDEKSIETMQKRYLEMQRRVESLSAKAEELRVHGEKMMELAHRAIPAQIYSPPSVPSELVKACSFSAPSISLSYAYDSVLDAKGIEKFRKMATEYNRKFNPSGDVDASLKRVQEFTLNLVKMLLTWCERCGSQESRTYELSTNEVALSGACFTQVGDAGEFDCAVIENEIKVDLQQYNRQLSEMWKGANEAFLRKGSDYKRQVLVSLRELCVHLLALLAPIDDVASWISEEDLPADFLYENRPVRKAQYHYVCRQTGMGDFLDHDAKALRLLFSELNKLHRPEVAINDEYLALVMLRVRHFVEFMITINTKDNALL